MAGGILGSDSWREGRRRYSRPPANYWWINNVWRPRPRELRETGYNWCRDIHLLVPLAPGSTHLHSYLSCLGVPRRPSLWCRPRFIYFIFSHLHTLVAFTSLTTQLLPLYRLCFSLYSWFSFIYTLLYTSSPLHQPTSIYFFDILAFLFFYRFSSFHFFTTSSPRSFGLLVFTRTFSFPSPSSIFFLPTFSSSSNLFATLLFTFLFTCFHIDSSVFCSPFISLSLSLIFHIL